MCEGTSDRQHGWSRIPFESEKHVINDYSSMGAVLHTEIHSKTPESMKELCVLSTHSVQSQSSQSQESNGKHQNIEEICAAQILTSNSSQWQLLIRRLATPFQASKYVALHWFWIFIVQVEINASSYDFDHLVRFLSKYNEELIQIIVDYWALKVLVILIHSSPFYREHRFGW